MRSLQKDEGAEMLAIMGPHWLRWKSLMETSERNGLTKLAAKYGKFRGAPNADPFSGPFSTGAFNLCFRLVKAALGMDWRFIRNEPGQGFRKTFPGPMGTSNERWENSGPNGTRSSKSLPVTLSIKSACRASWKPDRLLRLPRARESGGLRLWEPPLKLKPVPYPRPSLGRNWRSDSDKFKRRQQCRTLQQHSS